MVKKTKMDLAQELIDLLIPFEKIPDELRSSVNQVVLLRFELTKESDRGSALLASSFVDKMLENLLKKKLLGAKKHHDSLFNSNGPLSTFSNRINIAYSIGLLSDDHKHDLNLIRKIRNEFAHSLEIISFNDEPINSHCNSLKLVTSPFAKNARDQYISSIYYIVGSILVMIINEVKFAKRENKDFEAIKLSIEKFYSILK